MGVREMMVPRFIQAPVRSSAPLRRMMVPPFISRPAKSLTAPPTTIDEYLALVSEDKRAALQALREIIHAAAPDAEECISYQMPAFRLNGMLVGFAAAKAHCALYAWNGSTVGMCAS